ncbi:putative protein isoform X6 [Gossypium australe]|uniref:Uncharacterized protein n=1 Tax=Gossypium australe TaxID=47621 RepID=A0A5B6WJ97_9ROSI|nr:putative protein isoform X6 [Gossypium australe]
MECCHHRHNPDDDSPENNDNLSAEVIILDFLSTWLWVQTLETASVNRGRQHTLDLPLFIAKLLVHLNDMSQNDTSSTGYTCSFASSATSARLQQLGSTPKAANKLASLFISASKLAKARPNISSLCELNIEGCQELVDEAFSSAEAVTSLKSREGIAEIHKLNKF